MKTRTALKKHLPKVQSDRQSFRTYAVKDNFIRLLNSISPSYLAPSISDTMIKNTAFFSKPSTNLLVSIAAKKVTEPKIMPKPQTTIKKTMTSILPSP